MKKTPFKKIEVRPCDKCYKPLTLDEVGRCKKHVEMYGPAPVPQYNGKKPGRKPLPLEERKKRKYDWRTKAEKMPGKPLTDIELETLQMIATGVTSKTFEGKQTTFDSRVLKVRTKLKARSTPHAVAIAFRQGLIQ